MIILDASVVIKWFSEEEYTEKALELRERIRHGEEQVIVPDFLLYELSNALKHNPHFDVQDVCDALTSLFDMNIDIVTPLPEIIESAIELAFEHAITVYDAFYVALAKETGLSFITADKKLYERVRDLEFVKFIEEI
jgi:predicted nucleic acid-binding protein